MMRPIVLKPGVHCVLDTPLARQLRETHGDPSFFSYRHNRTRNWVIARWINRDAGLVIESCLFDPEDPSSVEAALESIAWQLAPGSLNDLRQLAEQVASEERSEQEATENEYDQMADWGDFMRSRVGVHKQDHPEWLLLGCDTTKCKVRA